MGGPLLGYTDCEIVSSCVWGIYHRRGYFGSSDGLVYTQRRYGEKVKLLTLAKSFRYVDVHLLEVLCATKVQ